MCTAAYNTAQTDASISAVEHWIANDVATTRQAQVNVSTTVHYVVAVE